MNVALSDPPNAGFVIGPGSGREPQALGHELRAMFAEQPEVDLAQAASQECMLAHQVTLSMRRTGSLCLCSTAPSPTAEVGSGSSTGLIPLVGMMRIPPPGAGTTRDPAAG